MDFVHGRWDYNGTTMCAAYTIRRFHQSWRALSAPGAIRMRRVLLLALVGTTAALGQKLTTTTDTALAAVIAMGTLTPANTSTLTTGQVQFRLRSKKANPSGYRLEAVATFTAGAAATVNGGDTIAATDIGIGITSVDSTASQVDQPRTDAILAGFSYDPTTVSVTDGLTPYTNAAEGKATLADLLASKKILSGNRIDATEALGSPNYLLVTMKFGVLPQYFSPSTFSSVITFTISSGP
jgi:hypothetical protein